MSRNRRRQNRLARRSAMFRPWAENLEARSLMAAFLVNSTVDEVALNPAAGTGLTEDGKITLRSAIQASNALGGANTITLPAGTYTLTIAGAGEDAAATGDLDIRSELTINGAGSATTTVNGGGLDRVFDINVAVNNPAGAVALAVGNSVGGVTLSGLTVTGGATHNNDIGGGGGIRISQGHATLSNVVVTNNHALAASGGGGGISNSGQLTMTGCIVSGNKAPSCGGGILNEGPEGTSLEMTDCTVSDNSSGAESGGQGGGDGGGIDNESQLTMTNCTVKDNTTGGDYGGSGSGGGIFNDDQLSMTGCTINNNTTSVGEGADGGGIDSESQLTMTDCTVSGNTADADGGGIYVFGNLTMTNCTVDGNSCGDEETGGDGAGIFLEGSDPTITGCTISNNIAGGNGGGLAARFDLASNLVMKNDTFSGNTAGGSGGGIYLASTGSNGILLINDTIAQNLASRGGNIAVQGSAPVRIGNTILAGSNTDDFFAESGTSVTTLGRNIVDDDSAEDIFNATDDFNDIDAMLGPLAPNGGPTMTMALLPGSPAINAGAATEDTPATDQRGVTRPQGSANDIGAFELVEGAQQIPTTTTLTSSASTSTFGQSVTFTATVSAAGSGLVPTGSVTFLEVTSTSMANSPGQGFTDGFTDGFTEGGPTSDTVVLGTIPLDDAGHAVFQASLPVGTHVIVASYPQTGEFGPSQSDPLTQVVNPVQTTAQLVSDANTSTFGQTVTLTATISATGSGLVPTGPVTFLEGTTVLGTAPLDDAGHAVFHTSLPVGTHVIVASYPQTGEFGPSQSSPLTQVVNPVQTTAQLVSDVSAAAVGQPVTFTATIAPTSGSRIPTGQVTFLDGANVLGTGTLDAAGQATLQVTSFDAGPHTITASYPGDGTFGPSVSTVANLVVSASAPGVSGVERFGFHTAPTTLVVAFTQPLDRSSAENTANYVIVGPHHRVIPVRTASYDSETQTVTLRPVDRLNIHRSYQLTIKGHSPGGLTGVGGLPLDGQGDGQPGTDFVTLISRANLVNDPAATHSTSSRSAARTPAKVNVHGHPRVVTLRAHLMRTFHAVTLSAFRSRNPKH